MNMQNVDNNFQKSSVPRGQQSGLVAGSCLFTAVFCVQTQKTRSSLCYDIHYWIGSQSTQDEQGAAAVYTLQLDEFLGSTPVQHREVQEHESDAFRGYFKQGIM